MLKRRINASASLLTVLLLAGGCKAAKAQDISFPYRIDSADGITLQSEDGHHTALGQDSFKILLVPEAGDVWTMEKVSILGLRFKNTGTTEMVIDTMLGNTGATGWSDSSLGRTVVKAGEEIPLTTAIYRGPTEKDYNIHFNRMAGTPNGHRRHWHTIDLTAVRTLEITCSSKGKHSFEFEKLYPVELMDESAMDKTPIVDRYGQYIHRDWPGKVSSDHEIIDSIEAEKELEKELGTPTGFTKYGGWKEGPKFEATGAFRTQKHEGRWWFIDPEGYLFWSYGVTCVGAEWASHAPLRGDLSIFKELPPKAGHDLSRFYTFLEVESSEYARQTDVPHYDFTRANLYRKYGKDWQEKYIDQTIKRMQYCNLNTIGAWSDTEIINRRKIPYTAMVHYDYASAGHKLPDPFHELTREGLRKALEEYPITFKDDPWCIGAFISNELHWHNSKLDLVKAIMGFEKENSEVKKVFRDWLKNKYQTIETFNESWSTAFTAWDDLLKANDKSIFSKADPDDCSKLCTIFAEASFKMVREELNTFDPDMLYLGCRFNVGCMEVAQAAGKYADVVSVNVYKYSPGVGRYGETQKPVLISEFHFSDLTGSNLGPGLRSAYDETQQGRLFESYMAEAVNHPMIVGAHWFQWHDQSVIGRWDGENYDIGFFDAVDKPNYSLIRAAESFGRTLYTDIK